ncbi:nucleotidyltransferase [Alkalihalobacillus sp. AL-G]|uniref:nucleotidyltransferase n=1 Tax=Alkalihalobacillus sp. AL-G TaxID=2926399 RepID=UPI00272B37B9|nr:nucleotidyltransferase [Alkalihalobacillus sp. AL-G]WLD95046.1 nucleotidyltransferase [Alkalihalobacillus sp. AL-G]
MNALGLIVEYNPFHNGHFYHLQEAKKKSEAELAIAVMSGNFLQRGEPAMVSKWTRTEMALRSGVDVVVELPYAYATQRADQFAFGAVAILDALLCRRIIFGSESGEIEPFLNTVSFIEQNERMYNERIQAQIQSGLSYPSAASRAFLEIPERPETTVDLSKPNNILGFHYINAIRKLNSSIIPETIKRTGAGYHDKENTSNTIASATGIRSKLIEHQEPLSSISELVPPATNDSLTKHLSAYQQFQSWEKYFPLLKYRLFTSTPSELSSIYECVEGLENRLLDLIKESESFHDFLNSVKTKRYTWTRLQRLCTHILTNTHKSVMEKATLSGPSYVRLLGMSPTGQQYLSQIKKKMALPLVSTVSQHDDPLIELDMRATKTYILGFPSDCHSTLWKQEYSTPPLRHQI